MLAAASEAGSVEGQCSRGVQLMVHMLGAAECAAQVWEAPLGQCEPTFTAALDAAVVYRCLVVEALCAMLAAASEPSALAARPQPELHRPQPELHKALA